MSADRLRVGLAQILSGPDPVANLDQVVTQVDAAAARGAELVVFPEATMRCFGRSLVDVAEPVDGPWATRLGQIATARGVVVAAGMFTPGGAGRVRNTLRVVGPGVDACYHKIHLFDAFGFRESDTVAAGTELLVTDVAGVRVGFATCYDVRFPGLFLALADRGAAVICLPASWGAGPGKLAQWEVLVRARALDSTSYVAAVGQADPATLGLAPHRNAPTGIGHSMLVSPTGEVLAALGPEPGLLVADCDLTALPTIRAGLPVLVNRRL